jgi:hypothetical protein
MVRSPRLPYPKKETLSRWGNGRWTDPFFSNWSKDRPFFRTGLWTDLFSNWSMDRPRNTEGHRNPPKSAERQLHDGNGGGAPRDGPLPCLTRSKARTKWRTRRRRAGCEGLARRRVGGRRVGVVCSLVDRSEQRGLEGSPRSRTTARCRRRARTRPSARGGDEGGARGERRAWPPRKWAVEGDGGGGGSEFVRRWSTT